MIEILLEEFGDATALATGKRTFACKKDKIPAAGLVALRHNSNNATLVGSENNLEQAAD